MELPTVYEVQSNVQETSDIFSLTLTTHDKAHFAFLPGQFNMVYLYGIGEVPLSISSRSDHPEVLMHTVRAVGLVTNGLQKLKISDTVGVRGPLGTAWPLTKTECDVVIIAGGVGLAPLRSALYYLAFHRKKYKKITLLYGARSPSDIMYKNDLKIWQQHEMTIEVSVDRGDTGWRGPVGVITPLIGKHITDPKNTLVFVCGPEIMMHFANKELMQAKVEEEHIFMSMERNMQCGTGFCGHCQYGPYFICKDGPVFPYQQIKKWLAIKEL